MKNLENMFMYEEADDSGAGDAPQTEETAPVETTQPVTQEATQLLINEEGKFSENWKDTLGDDFKENASLSKFTTLEGLAKSYVNLEKMIGKKQEVGQFADDTEKAEFFTKLGKPETPEGYWIDKPEGHPEDAPYDENQVKWFANIAHKYNLTDEQFKGLREEYYNLQMDSYSKANEQIKIENEKAVKALEEEWGREGSETYNASMQNAQKTIDALQKEVGDAENIREQIEKMGLANYPPLFKLLSKLGNNIGEDMLPDGSTVSSVTRDQAQSRIAEIKANPAYTDMNHPQQKELVKEMQKLYQLLYPEEK